VQVMAARTLIGSLVNVVITDIGTNTLFGEIEHRTPVLAAAGA
jgi:hypothetical protein